jgi:hypothetical protein
VKKAIGRGCVDMERLQSRLQRIEMQYLRCARRTLHKNFEIFPCSSVDSVAIATYPCTNARAGFFTFHLLLLTSYFSVCFRGYNLAIKTMR